MTGRIFGITGWKNFGKTTLTCKLVANGGCESHLPVFSVDDITAIADPITAQTGLHTGSRA